MQKFEIIQFSKALKIAGRKLQLLLIQLLLINVDGTHGLQPYDLKYVKYYF